jgi:hypothetical protein
MITWEPSKQTPDTTYGRIGEIQYFKIHLNYGYKRILAARSFGTITTKNPDIPNWVRVGYYPTDDDARKAAEELWPRYLKRLRLAPAADFIDYIGEGAQHAIIEAIKTAAQEAAAETGSMMQQELGSYGGTVDDLRTPDYDGWAAEAAKTAIKALIDRGILPPNTL